MDDRRPIQAERLVFAAILIERFSAIFSLCSGADPEIHARKNRKTFCSKAQTSEG